jgi:DNA-binding transcriptional MerR regulator
MNPPRPRNLTPSQAAVRLGVSAKALRLYEQQGLIAPGRSSGGWRLYSPPDLERAATIVSLRALGLSLAEVASVLGGDPGALTGALAAHEERLRRQAGHIDAALRKVRRLRESVDKGEAVDAAALEGALGRNAPIAVGFELPWPWAGEWFELRDIAPLNFITGPLGSGKTRFAERLARELPEAAFLGLDRLEGAAAAPARAEDGALAARVRRTMDWLAEEGAVRSEALLGLVVALETESPAILVIDMVEEGLCEATQRALIASFRVRPGPKRALFLMTRSSSILDLDLAGTAETILYCPANHAPPFQACVHPGGRGYEAVATCLAAPEARARTACIRAVATGAAA